MDRAAEPSELVLLANDAMRARRRPLMILLVWGWEIVWAFGIVWPLVRLVGNAYGDHPDGDGMLFRAGSFELVDFLLNARAAAPAIAGHVAVLLPAGIALGLLPLAGLIASMAYATRERRPPSLRQLWPRIVSSFAPLGILLVLAGIAMGALAAAPIALGAAIASAYADRLGAPQADQLGLAVAAVGLLFPCFVGILHDVARTAVVRFQMKALPAIALAWRAVALHPLGECWSYVWRALVSWPLIGLGAFLASRLGGRPGIALFVLFAVHQLIVLARVALRASWLAKALRAVDGAHRVDGYGRGRTITPPGGIPVRPTTLPEQAIDIPVHTDEPSAPTLDRGA